MGSPVRKSTRLILSLGFGSLLLLITALGIETVRRTNQIYSELGSIQDAYRHRSSVLNDIEADLYRLGVLFRDYLLDRDKAAGADYRKQLMEVRAAAGRTKLVGSNLQEMLRCLRCGACMSHCPVYQNIGGHAYGWVYPGPMGSILTPVYVGLENAGDLPNAATFCGECAVACPVKIPLPDLMRKLREQQFDRKLRPWPERAVIALWSFLAARTGLYALATRVGARVASWMGGREGLIHSLPGIDGWTKGRDMPAPAGMTFRELYRQRAREQGRTRMKN